MKFFSYIFSALAVSLLPVLTAAGDHLNARNNHQGIARRAEGHLLDRRQSTHARWSWYDTQTGNAGSCGRHLNNNEFVVAMNVPQYRANNCFKYITMTWRGKTTRAQIVDMCPGCPYGGLDLSPGLFRFFADLGMGIIPDGTWSFEGDAPPPPPPPTSTRTTSRWTPPPTPTQTTTRRTSTSTTQTPTTTSTRTTSSTTSSSSSSVSETSTSAGTEPTSAARLNGTNSDNLGGIFEASVSLGQLLLAGAGAGAAQ